MLKEKKVLFPTYLILQLTKNKCRENSVQDNLKVYLIIKPISLMQTYGINSEKYSVNSCSVPSPIWQLVALFRPL